MQLEALYAIKLDENKSGNNHYKRSFKRKYDLELSRDILNKAIILNNFSAGSVEHATVILFLIVVFLKSRHHRFISRVRHGTLDGLRFYWDYAPKVEETYDETNNLSLSWNRAVIGWAFYTSGLVLQIVFLSLLV